MIFVLYIASKDSIQSIRYRFIVEIHQTVGLETRFKAYTVWLILKGETEEALEKLAEHYDTDTPKFKVGLPKRHKTGVLGCYSARDKTISVLNNDMLSQPSVIIHEFYHHLRTGIDHKHKGTERYARDFAKDYIDAYKTTINSKKDS